MFYGWYLLALSYCTTPAVAISLMYLSLWCASTIHGLLICSITIEKTWNLWQIIIILSIYVQTLASQPNQQWLIEPLKLCWTSLGTVYLMLTHRWMSDFSPLSLRNGSMEWFMFHLMGLCGQVMLYYQRRLAFPRRPWLRTAAHSTCVLPTMWYLIIWLFFHFRCL